MNQDLQDFRIFRITKEELHRLFLRMDKEKF